MLVRAAGHANNAHAEATVGGILGTSSRDSDGAPSRRVVQHVLVEGSADGDDKSFPRACSKAQRQLNKRAMRGVDAQHRAHRIPHKMKIPAHSCRSIQRNQWSM